MSEDTKGVIRIRISRKSRHHNVLKIQRGNLWYTDSDYPFGIFKTLCCLFFFDIRILITQLYLQDIILSVLPRFTDPHPWRYQRGNQNPYIKEEQTIYCLEDTKGETRILYYLFFLDLRILITPLISWRHCVVCSSSNYGFWLPLCIFKTLWCLLFFDIRILIPKG
jgi:hypothetical protein